MTSMGPTSKKEEEAAAARAPAQAPTPTPKERRPKRKTGKETTGFGSFPRRALETPTKRTMGTSPLREQEETSGGGKRRLWLRGKTDEETTLRKNPELVSSSGSAEQEPTTQDPTTRNALSDICNPDLIASGQIRSTDLSKFPQGKFIDEGVQKLTECLSELPGKTVGTVIRKPPCFRLNFLSAIADLENGTDKDFLKNFQTGKQ